MNLQGNARDEEEEEGRTEYRWRRCILKELTTAGARMDERDTERQRVAECSEQSGPESCYVGIAGAQPRLAGRARTRLTLLS